MIRPPLPQSPIADAGGYVSREWWRWFASLTSDEFADELIMLAQLLSVMTQLSAGKGITITGNTVALTTPVALVNGGTNADLSAVATNRLIGKAASALASSAVLDDGLHLVYSLNEPYTADVSGSINQAANTALIIPAAGGRGGLALISYNTGGSAIRQYNLGGGTLALPVALPINSSLSTSSAFAWNGSAYVRGGRIFYSTSQTWTGSINSCGFTIETVPVGGSGASTAAAKFQGGWQALNAGAAPTGGDKGGGTINVTAGFYIQGVPQALAPMAVASLPAASGNQGARLFVTDATATTFASIVAGLGANAVPVYSDGTNWRIG